MGGDWHDLGGGLTDGAGDSVSLQPLARIDDAAERAWAAEWLAAILTREGVTITPEVKEHLWSALTSLASRAGRASARSPALRSCFSRNALKQALRPYCVGGPWGRLLDAETEQLGEATVQAFETEGLIGTGAAPAVLAYLFHRIEDRLDGRPTLLIIDEGWLALDDEGFAGQLREWLKTLRKKNASASSSPRSRSPTSTARRSRRPSSRAARRGSSCRTSARSSRRSPRSIGASASTTARSRSSRRATPKRDYYCQSRRGNRLFELGLSEVALALCAASSKTDQAAIERDRRRARPRRLPARLAAPSRPRLGRRPHPRPHQPGDVSHDASARSPRGAARRVHPVACTVALSPVYGAAGVRAMDRLRPDQLRPERADGRARAAADQQPDPSLQNQARC